MKSLTVACLLVLPACGVEQARPSPLPIHSVVEDSAGIALVTNVAPPLQLWAEHAPVVDIGGRRAAEPYRLFHVTDARRLPDGTILIANSGTQQIRMYGPDGRFRRAVGRSGDGPGEFRLPLTLATLGSRGFAVWDLRLRRLAIFDSTGTFIRQAQPRARATNPGLVTVFEDGSFVLQDERLVLPPTGFGQQRITLVRYDAAGTVRDSLADIPAGPLGRLGGSGMVGAPLFAPRTAVGGTADGNRLFIGAGDRYEVAMLGHDARLLRLVRWSGPPLDVAARDVEAHWAERLASAPDQDRRLAVQHVRNATPVAERMPAFQRILPGADGIFWVQEFPRPSDTGPSRWWSFDRSGRIAAVAEVPRDFWPTDAGADWMLGITRASDGEHVMLYRMVAVQP